MLLTPRTGGRSGSKGCPKRGHPSSGGSPSGPCRRDRLLASSGDEAKREVESVRLENEALRAENLATRGVNEISAEAERRAAVAAEEARRESEDLRVRYTAAEEARVVAVAEADRHAVAAADARRKSKRSGLNSQKGALERDDAVPRLIGMPPPPMRSARTTLRCALGSPRWSVIPMQRFKVTRRPMPTSWRGSPHSKGPSQRPGAGGLHGRCAA